MAAAKDKYKNHMGLKVGNRKENQKKIHSGMYQGWRPLRTKGQDDSRPIIVPRWIELGGKKKPPNLSPSVTKSETSFFVFIPVGKVKKKLSHLSHFSDLLLTPWLTV